MTKTEPDQPQGNICLDAENRTKNEGVKPADSEPKRSDFRIAAISGTSAILGVLMGSLVTGFFSLKAQSLVVEQQKVGLSRQIAYGERQELKKAISDYIEVICDYYELLIMRDKLSQGDIEIFARKALKAGLYITVAVSPDLGKKTMEMNSVLLGKLSTKTKSINYLDDAEVDIIKKFTEWLVVMQAELKILDYTASPENLSSDLLRLLLRRGISTLNAQ